MATATITNVPPAGFGRGRRHSTIAVLDATAAYWRSAALGPDGWDPGEGLTSWWAAAASGFLNGARWASFNLVWRPWQKEETPDHVAASLVDCDAVVLVALHDEQLPVIDLFLEAEVPVVLAYSRSSDPRVSWVACDDRGGIMRAVRHLARLGHHQIGYLAGPRDVLDSREREQGYRDGMLQAGLPVASEWIVSAGTERDEPGVKAASTHLLHASSRPTAVVGVTDSVVIDAMEQARRLGLRVPTDLAAVGFNDAPEARQISPQLTTIRQPTLEIANWACHLAACCVTGRSPLLGAWQLNLPTTLVVRESCGAAPPLPGGLDDVLGPDSPEAVREELVRRLRQLAAMEQEMHEVLYVASHDLRSPLVTIQGFASNLQRKHAGQLDEKGQHCLDRIGRSVDSMEALIGSLLTLSRVHSEPLDLRPVATREVLLRVVDDLEGLLREKQARVRIPHRMPDVLADEVALYQVFLNLVGNALKYLGEQPTPVVSVSCQVLPEEYQFTVRDNGIGLAPEHHEEVFQPFRRLGKPGVEGAGIGLATVKRIVLRHGGRVWVDSQLGQGAAFRFTLPRREVARGESEAPAQSCSQAARP